MEVLAASFILAICITPALEALYSGIQGSGIAKTTAVDILYLNDKMAEIQNQAFSLLSAAAGNPTSPSSYSDVITTADNRQLSRTVYLSRYDGNNADGDDNGFTGTDNDLIWIKVELAGTAYSVETLISNYE